MSELALKLINECYETKSPYLELGNCGLRDEDFLLDSPIGIALRKCTHLKTLILSNEWFDITLDGFTLSKHNENRNKLAVIPTVVGDLARLSSFICCGDYNSPWDIEQMTPLASLSHLHHLDLSNNNIREIKGLDTLSTLHRLDLDNNSITDITGLDTLTALQHLNLSYNEIVTITGLDALKALQKLYLHHNEITTLQGLNNLTALESLALNSNKITEVNGLMALNALHVLGLHDNKIKEIKGLDSLTRLQELNLSGNKITEITGLKALTALKELHLSGNQIREIKELETLTALRNLYLSHNLIKEIKGLEGVTSLDILNLNNNQISDIRGLEYLSVLRELYVDYNKIIEINNLNGLHLLTTLFIQHNLVRDVSGVLLLENLNYVYLASNPIVNDIPPEVMAAGWPAIRDRLLEVDTLVVFKEVKVLLLGNTNVGKSNLLEYLEKGIITEGNESTHGIRYSSLSTLIPDTNLHFWDFGGQEYFHATHQLFFSPGALHIVLWSKTDIPREDGSAEACFDLHYWLRCIEQLVPKESGKQIEVIVAENKIDMNGLMATSLNQLLYKDKISHFNFHFTQFSLTALKRLHDFKELLTERVESLYTTHSPTYKRYLETIQQSSEDVLSLSDIDPNIAKVKTAVEVFHKMGIVLYFPGIIPDKVFVKPQALLGLLYEKILGKDRKEVITEAAISQAIEGHRWNLTLPQIITLLKHFDLVFQIPDNNQFFYIPQYLKDAPLLVEFFEQHYFQAANIRIESDLYLMNLAMLKIFAAYGCYVKRKGANERLFWKDGIIIEKNNALLMVKFNPSRQSIELFPDANHKNFDLQKEVVQFILTFSSKRKRRFDGVIKKLTEATFMGLLPQEGSKKISDQQMMVENEIMEGEISWKSDYFSVLISLDGQFFTSWSKLKHNVDNGIFQIEAVSKVFNETEKKPETKVKTISVFDYNKYLPKENKGQMKKLFISYSKDDLPLVNKFIEHLSTLQLDGKVAHWFCTELAAGTDWHYEIQEHFDQSDMVVFMVSPNFMKTKYIHEHEVKKAFERQAKDTKFKIVPIILDFCKWTTAHNNLGQFTALPYTAKPVVDFNNQNMAWYIIQECLRLMIEKDLQPVGEDFYSSQALPKDVLRLLERIVAGKADA